MYSAVGEYDYIWARYLAFTGQEYRPFFPPDKDEENYVLRVMNKDGKFVRPEELESEFAPRSPNSII